MTTTKIITAENLIADYATDIAFVAEEEPATTLADLAAQLYACGDPFEMAGFTDAKEEADAAATYLTDAAASTDPTERAVLLKKAAERLPYVGDIASEYRDMC
ncbi:hypothetical protein ACIOEZ_34425 [Streptomyces sp. NPDC087866]|uniref:hypothetical protein n=1 Tax=Streptomyces sp. NPDC087866 TaxID=3365815 RepID=UPI0037F4E9BD